MGRTHARASALPVGLAQESIRLLLHGRDHALKGPSSTDQRLWLTPRACTRVHKHTLARVLPLGPTCFLKGYSASADWFIPHKFVDKIVDFANMKGWDLDGDGHELPC